MYNAIHKSEFFRLMTYMKPRMLPYAIGIIGNCIVDAGSSIIVAFAMRNLINAAVNRQQSLLVSAIILLCIMVLAIGILSPLFLYLYSSSVKKTMADIRLKFFRHMEELPVEYFETNHSGDLTSRMINDIQAIEGAYAEQLRMVIHTLIYGISSAVIMFLLDWRVALILILLGFASTFANTRFAPVLRHLSDIIQQKQGVLTERLTDLLAGRSVVKMFHLENIIVGRYSETNKELQRLSIERAGKTALLDAVNVLLIKLNFGGMLVIGSFMVLSNLINFGTLVAITQLLQGVTFMFVRLGNFISGLQASLAGAARVFEVLDRPVEPEKYNVPWEQSEDAMIEMKNVSFSYKKGEEVLCGLDLKVKKGQVAALAGLSGCGKSTIIKLLMGFYKPDGGSITIDNRPMTQYSLEELRNMFAYVPQDAYLFDGTVGENIRFGRSDASDDEVIAAAKAANAHDFILEQPDGYNTLIGERAIRLSGGQKQRIAIARALLKNAPVLLLDEATSSLDSESEQLVQDSLKVLAEGRTVIVVAHRLSTIMHADLICIIDGGRVVEQGRHDNLVENGGIYSRLHKTCLAV